MEPTDLTPHDPADRDLEILLRQRPAPLDDDGFTQRVLAALPAPNVASASSSSARRFFIAAGAAGGITLAIVRVGSFSALPSDWAPVAQSIEQIVAAVADPRALAALVVAAVSALYAFLSATLRKQ